jgi:hypothetical protein
MNTIVYILKKLIGDKMTVYKLTVNLDATLAVQNENGSFHYFKPSVGAEITTDETEDTTILNQKFEDLFDNVIGPNFTEIVTQLLTNSKEDESEEKDEDKKCGCKNEFCECQPLEIAKKIYHEGPQKAYVADGVFINTDAEGLPKEEWE